MPDEAVKELDKHVENNPFVSSRSEAIKFAVMEYLSGDFRDYLDWAADQLDENNE